MKQSENLTSFQKECFFLKEFKAFSNVIPNNMIFLYFQGQYLEVLPYLTFGIMSLLASILILRLPETLKRKLPDTLSEAEQIGRESDDETS